MSFSSALGDLGSSVLGSPKKAVLIIRKPEPTGGGGIGGALGGAKQALSGAVDSALSAIGFGQNSLEVQYNPSSISYQANTSETKFNYMQSFEDNGIPNQLQRPPSIEMSVELIFDDVSIKDAFMLEKFRLQTAGDAIGAVSGIVKSLKGGYTVQPQTNGLVALLMRKETRHVTFQWNDLSFSGIVTSAQAKYTMFSVSGKPIRSSVRLGILQEVEDSAAITYWDKAFDNCFGEAGIGKIAGGRSVGQLAGNLLNIGF